MTKRTVAAAGIAAIMLAGGLELLHAGVASAQATAEREYKRVDIPFGEISSFNRNLNEAAKGGWRLVSAQGNTYIFERIGR